MSYRDQALAYAKWRSITKEDMDEDGGEFEWYITQMTTIFENLDTMPIIKAFALAEKDDWIAKHYRNVIEFLLH